LGSCSVGQSVSFGLEFPDAAEALAEPQLLLESLCRHKVLVLRDVGITRAEFVGLGQLFGQLELHPTLPRAEDAREVSLIETGPDAPPSSEAWHFDAAWGRPPCAVTLLRNIATPPKGGDTLFLDATDLADRLLDEFGPTAHETRVVHRSSDSTVVEEAPLLRRHPVTSRWAVLVNPALVREPGDLRHAPSALTIEWLRAAMDNVCPSFRVRWLTRSLAIWDNRAVLHRLQYDFPPFVRRMERISVAGR